MNEILYVDLDGVLVDLDKAYKELTGIDLSDYKAGERHLPQDAFWKPIQDQYDLGVSWFMELPMMEDAMELWNAVAPYNPQILTSLGHEIIPSIGAEKKMWVKKHLGENVRVNFSKTSNDKSKLADANSVLIDDSQHSIIPWIESGGIGILHKSAVTTIQQLKYLKVIM